MRKSKLASLILCEGTSEVTVHFMPGEEGGMRDGMKDQICVEGGGRVEHILYDRKERRTNTVRIWDGGRLSTREGSGTVEGV